MSAGGLLACGYPPLAPPGASDGGIDGEADAGVVDGTGSIDAAPSSRLRFNLPDFNMAQRQVVRFRVLQVRDGSSDLDVSVDATCTPDNPTIATVPMDRRITSGVVAGTTTITATFEDAAPASVRVTVTSVACHVVINELATAGATAADEWVELYNPCATMISVDGWTLVYRAANATGNLDSSLLFTLAGQMEPGELRLYAGQGYPGIADGKWPDLNGQLGLTAGAVGLRSGPMSTGTLVDAVAYGPVSAGHPFLENAAAPALAAGRSAARMPFDGRDDNDGIIDFALATTPTPQSLNAP